MEYYWPKEHGRNNNYPIQKDLSLRVDDIPGTKPSIKANKNVRHYQERLTRGDNNSYLGSEDLYQLYLRQQELSNDSSRAMNKNDSQKKHYRVNYQHELAGYGIRDGSEHKDAQFGKFNYPRSLCVQDIAGTKPGTLQSKGVKNFDLASRIRTETSPSQQRPTDHNQYVANNSRLGSYTNEYQRQQAYQKQESGRSWSQDNSRHPSQNSNIIRNYHYRNANLSKDQPLSAENDSRHIVMTEENQPRVAHITASRVLSNHKYAGQMNNFQNLIANMPKDNNAIRPNYHYSQSQESYLGNEDPRGSSQDEKDKLQFRFSVNASQKEDFEKFYNQLNKVDQELAKPVNVVESNQATQDKDKNCNLPPLNNPKESHASTSANQDNTRARSVPHQNELRKVSIPNKEPNQIPSLKAKENFSAKIQIPRNNFDQDEKTIKSADILANQRFAGKRNDESRSGRHLNYTSEENNGQKKKVYVFDIIANQPSLKMVPAKSKLPYKYGYQLEQGRDVRGAERSNYPTSQL